MENPQRPRLEPRLVFVAVMVAIPLLYVVAQVVLVRSGDDCAANQVGGVGQMFLPGVGCEQPAPSPARTP